MDCIHLVTALSEYWDWLASGGFYESMLRAYCLDVVIDERRADEDSWRQAGDDSKDIWYSLVAKKNI